MTWILPKNLELSNFARVTEAFVSDLDEQSRICASLLLVRSKVLQQRTWSLKWKRDSWTRHLSGRILKPSQASSFTDLLTSSLRVSRVNHSAQQGTVTPMMTRDTCSLTLNSQSSTCNRPLSFLKTSKGSSAPSSSQMTGQTKREQPFCSMSSESWKEWVTQQRQEYSARKKLVLPTAENGCSSSLNYPTPDCCPDAPDKNSNKTNGPKSLREAANWPTASARDWKDTPGMSTMRDGRGGDRTHRPAAEDGVLLWPSRPGEPQHGWEPPRVVGQTESPMGGNTDGATDWLDNAELYTTCDNRTDELRLLGNGVVPATAELAFIVLMNKLVKKC